MWRVTNPTGNKKSFEVGGIFIVLNPSESMDLNDKPSVNDLVIELIDENKKITRSYLEGLTISQIRDIVKKNNLRAKDTDKKELINEIMNEVN